MAIASHRSIVTIVLHAIEWRIKTYRLLHVCNAYRPPSSRRNSSVNRVSSPHGMFASTWISSCESERCANRLRPIERTFT